MKVLIRIQGRDFVPLAAVPTVTNDVVTVEDIVRQMVNADAFADPDHELLPVVIQVSPNGETRAVSEGEFRRWFPRVKDKSPKMSISESASILVRANELRALFKLLRESDCSVGPSESSMADWDETRELPKEIETAIRDYCLNYLSPRHRRKNSKAAKLDRFREAIAQLQQRALSSGIDFDPLQLPGRKQEFLAALHAIDPNLPKVTVGTFDKQYAGELGLGWRQGSRPKDAIPLLRLVGLKLKI